MGGAPNKEKYVTDKDAKLIGLFRYHKLKTRFQERD